MPMAALPSITYARPVSFAEDAKALGPFQRNSRGEAKKFRALQDADCNTRSPIFDAMALVQTNPDAYVIKPEAAAPAIDTSDWPLLLKNYSDRMQPAQDIASESLS